MSINNLLQELEENKVPTESLEIAKDNTIAPIDTFTPSPTQKKEIIQKYLEGKDKREIASVYGVSTRTITNIVENNSDIRLETEKRYQSTAMARENYRLSETKNKLLTFVDKTLEDAMANPEELTTAIKLKTLNSIAALFDKLSVTSRLNADKPTNISESRELNIDLDKVLKELPTNEDKLNFLRGQNSTGTMVKPITVLTVEEEEEEEEELNTSQ